VQLAWKIAEGSKVKLKDYDPDFIDKYTDRALAAAELEQLGAELGELQGLLAAAQHHSLLIARPEDSSTCLSERICASSADGMPQV
jgi:hypothetical protein